LTAPESIEVLVRFSRLASEANSGADILPLLADASIDHVGAAGAAVVVVTETGTARVAASRDVPRELSEWTGDAEAIGSELGKQLLRQSNGAFAAAHPVILMSGGGLFGALVLFFAENNLPGERELQVARGLADLAAVAMGRATQIAKLAQANAELRASREVLARTEELRALGQMAATAAEVASAAKSECLSSMSHELRTPLNAILGFAQLLRRDKKEPLTERHHRQIDQILRGGEHLLRLIDDILDLARIEAGGVSISTEPVDVGNVLGEVSRTLEPMAAQHNVQVGGEAPADLPMVAADRTRIVQILMNFGSNAIKYNRPMGTVTFRVSTIPGRVRVTVADTGVGIPADKQDRLFQPFQRAGQEAGPIQGTGIGLVITKRLAQLMGGDVGFRSVLGKGSEFWVDMPVDLSGKRSSAPPPAPERSSERLVSDRPRRVLYVEDNPANVTFMSDLVSTMDDVELLTASTAEMGIELARARRPDAIVMDVNLPGMSGVDALRELRTRPETRDIPVIALTAAASQVDKRRGAEAGFARYLTKPVKVDEFVAALETALASLR
jgi:signal transduction histidine kinase/ActR/RegA family two-component response regulator